MIWYLADAPVVHTTGVNLESVLTIVISIVVAVVAVGGWLDSRLQRRQNAVKSEITEAVTHLSDVLIERLETKENVASLRTEVATLAVKMELIGRQTHSGTGRGGATGGV